MLLNLFKISRLQLLATPMSRGFRPPGRRRVSAARRRRSGGLRRSRPREFCVSCESVRDWLFGDIEPVVGEHIVERLSEQWPHGVAGQWVPDQHDTVVPVEQERMVARIGRDRMVYRSKIVIFINNHGKINAMWL
mgnify:CR=1 FL=1